MAWSVTLNGTTYTDADFAGYGYVTKLPAMLVDAAVDVAGKVAAAAEHVATALGYKNAAAGSAAAAAEQASQATTNGAAQVELAAEQVGIAADHASAAAQSVIDAAALLDQFDDRYLGVKAADPLLDNDGNPLVAGAIYINSVSGYLRAYTGAAWVQGISVIAGVESLNGLQGAITVKTINGATITGAGNIDTATPDLFAFAAAQG